MSVTAGRSQEEESTILGLVTDAFLMFKQPDVYCVWLLIIGR